MWFQVKFESNIIHVNWRDPLQLDLQNYFALRVEQIRVIVDLSKRNFWTLMLEFFCNICREFISTLYQYSVNILQWMAYIVNEILLCKYIIQSLFMCYKVSHVGWLQIKRLYTNEMLESMKKVEAARSENAVLEPRRMTAEEKEALLRTYPPDYKESEFAVLEIGPNKGEKVPTEL